jgi:hypothetical protein
MSFRKMPDKHKGSWCRPNLTVYAFEVRNELPSGDSGQGGGARDACSNSFSWYLLGKLALGGAEGYFESALTVILVRHLRLVESSRLFQRLVLGCPSTIGASVLVGSCPRFGHMRRNTAPFVAIVWSHTLTL